MRKMCENAVLFLDPHVVTKDRGAPWLDCRDNYEWYYTYGFAYQPRSLLEVGVRFGYSAISICTGCSVPPNLVVLVDDGRDEPEGLEHAKTCLDGLFPAINVITHAWDTQKLDFGLVIEGRPFDMIHIDADHRPDAVRHDFEFFWPFLKSGGMMILDDMRSLAGERCVPLMFHVLPWLMDRQDVRILNFVNNYNCQLLVEKGP